MKLFYLVIFRYEKLPRQADGDGTKNDVHELWHEIDVSSFGFFVRSLAAEFIRWGADFSIKRIEPGQQRKMELRPEDNSANIPQKCFAHSYARQDGLAAVLVSDEDYPELPAQNLLKKVLEDFSSQHPRSEWARGDKPPKIAFKFYDKAEESKPAAQQNKTYIQKWTKPEEADQMTNIQRQLDETHGILHTTMKELLERGEKLDSLVAKSDNLSSQSKAFYKQAQKQNSCCAVM